MTRLHQMLGNDDRANRSPGRMALWMDWSFGRWDRWSRLASNPEGGVEYPSEGPEGMVGQNLRCGSLGHERWCHIDRRLQHQTVRHTP